MANKQLFEPNWICFPFKRKSESSSAETADRPGRDFQRPHSIVVDSKLRVDWSMGQTQSSRCVSRAFLDGALQGFGKPRRCDVDRLFEVRAFQRIGLVKDRQDAQSAILEKSLDGHFPPRNVAFHKHLIEIGLASGKNLRGLEQPPDTGRGRKKLLTIVRAHDALTGGKRKRFQHTGIRDAQQHGLGRGIDGKIPKPRDRQPGISKDFFHAQLAPASLHSRRMVVTDSQTPGGISGSGSGPVTESKNSADILAAKRFHHGVGSCLRRFEMHGDGLIAPGIFQLVASVGDVNQLHAQLVRGIFKTSRLVTQFRRKEQQSFGRIRHW